MSTKAKADRLRAMKAATARALRVERARKKEREAKRRKLVERNAEVCRAVAERYRRLNPGLTDAEALAAVTKPELSREETAALMVAIEKETETIEMEMGLPPKKK